MANPAAQPGRAIQFADSVIDGRTSASLALTLHFLPGQRPAAGDIVRLAGRPAETTGFAPSFLPPEGDGWLELIAMGLTYDVSGLFPAGAAPAIDAEHFYGFEASGREPRLEAVRVVPGPHLTAGRPPIPVIRVLAGLGAELARLPGLRAIGWQSASSAMSPAYFMSAVRAWLVGGAFPALGLTALFPAGDGTIRSEGLALFTGLELQVEPVAGETPQELAKFAALAAHVLVQSGQEGLSSLVDASGRPGNSDIDLVKGLVRLWRKG